MRQMANHEMKNLSEFDSDPPSCARQTNSIILAGSWRQPGTIPAAGGNVAMPRLEDTIAQPKKTTVKTWRYA
jgi:hypothetical protein